MGMVGLQFSCLGLWVRLLYYGMYTFLITFLNTVIVVSVA